MFHVQGFWTLCEGVPTSLTFLCLAQGSFKLPRGGPGKQDAYPKDQSLELTTRVASYPEVALTVETGPTMRWVGPETLVDVVLEGCKASALADSSSQVNKMTPEFIQE